MTFSPESPVLFLNPSYVPAGGDVVAVTDPANLEAVGRYAETTAAEIARDPHPRQCGAGAVEGGRCQVARQGAA